MTERAWFPLTLLVLSNVRMVRILRTTLRAAMACGHAVALRSCSGLMTFAGGGESLCLLNPSHD